jgi:hypothetical protein
MYSFIFYKFSLILYKRFRCLHRLLYPRRLKTQRLAFGTGEVLKRNEGAV